jgi:hypothetical protein
MKSKILKTIDIIVVALVIIYGFCCLWVSVKNPELTQMQVIYKVLGID